LPIPGCIHPFWFLTVFHTLRSVCTRLHCNTNDRPEPCNGSKRPPGGAGAPAWHS
jgi:hypothetical protein